jgi:hypothetical protein
MAAIYGVEHAGSTDALVIESAEGPTLADRIASGPIPHNANNGFRPMLSFTSEISVARNDDSAVLSLSARLRVDYSHICDVDGVISQVRRSGRDARVILCRVCHAQLSKRGEQ